MLACSLLLDTSDGQAEAEDGRLAILALKDANAAVSFFAAKQIPPFFRTKDEERASKLGAESECLRISHTLLALFRIMMLRSRGLALHLRLLGIDLTIRGSARRELLSFGAERLEALP